ncbi:phenylalanine--tRNA ligase subunit beta [Actinomycetaceae bacterium TAE3-ERU4]|nr:phenylalanine--tRNA ligase subunit beta [Actinomycetaceae bacterium TAE3-ERU4]
MPYVSLEWLSEHVELQPEATVSQLAADLVRVGLEEERIVPPAVTGPLVVGKVLTREPKEQSNGKIINYCRVDVGSYNDAPGTGREPSDLPSRGIICGAHNFEVGNYVVVSLPGACLPGGFEIAARKTYGHISDGMMCSETELGLSDSSEGIIILEDYLDGEVPPVGSDLVSLLGLGEELLEINITPDRGYCFSMRGVAREYSHSTGNTFIDPALEGNQVKKVLPPSADAFEVLLDDVQPIRGKSGCDRFVTRVLEGINPQAPTPAWMEKRIIAAGMRPISLIVDVTNYVMLDLGQPLHAYDLAKLSAPLVVRRARSAEKLETLDGVVRNLDEQDLLIADSPSETGSRPLGLAGVMGGAYSEVGEQTTSILLEAAHFDSVSIARSARRHRLPSEAAKRFERGVDFNLPAIAAQRAVDLLVEYGGATDTGRVGDIDNTSVLPELLFDWHAPSTLIGVDYTRAEVISSLEEIGCKVISDASDMLRVQPPSWRPDLSGSAHLIEEIVRLHGYDQVPSILPQARAGGGLPADQKARRKVANVLCAQGLSQVLSYPFIGAAHDKQLIPQDDIRRKAVRLANPLAEDAPYLRTSILDSLLEVAARNVSRGTTSLAIFETGMVTHPEGTPKAHLPQDFTPSAEEIALIHSQVPNQPWHIGGVFAGATSVPAPGSFSRDYDWADSINAVRSVASTLGVNIDCAQPLTTDSDSQYINRRALEAQGVTAVEAASLAPFHPGRVAQLRLRVGKKLHVVGYAGELHPQVVDNYNLPKRTCAFELDLSLVIQAMSNTPLQVKPVSTYPVAKEDIALVVPVEVCVSDLLVEIKKAAGPLLEDVYLFDDYRSSQLGEGLKSLAFALRMRGADCTLSAEQTAEIRKRIVAQAKKRFGAQLRG